jgi:phage terminase small subunit
VTATIENGGRSEDKLVGSEPLRIARKERFCRNVITGKHKTDVDAYISAGYSERNARKNATTLRKNKDVDNRIRFLQNREADKAIASAEERKKILTEIARGRLTNFVIADESGTHIRVDPESLDNRAVKGLKSRRVPGHGEDAPDEVITEIQLADPVKAINELNRMDGSHSPKKLNIKGELRTVADLIIQADEDDNSSTEDAG